LSFAYEEAWEQAKIIFNDIKPTSKYHELALQFISLSDQGTKLKKKNPKTAAILGVVPGLGYLYCGYQKTALSSLLVNGLLMWGTHSAFNEDNHGVGLFLSGTSLGLYAGNIFGSYQTAIERNKKTLEDHLEQFHLDCLK